jgi:hypothetical protein
VALWSKRPGVLLVEFLQALEPFHSLLAPSQLTRSVHKQLVTIRSVSELNYRYQASSITL